MLVHMISNWQSLGDWPGLKYCRVVISAFALLVGTVFFLIISDKIIVRDSLDFSLYTNDLQYALIRGWSCLSSSAWTNRVPRKHSECIWRLLQPVLELDLEFLFLMAMCFLFNPSWQTMNEFTWVCLGCSQVCFKCKTTYGFEVLQSLAWDSTFCQKKSSGSLNFLASWLRSRRFVVV